MKASEIITKITNTNSCLLIRHRKEERQKGSPYNYDVKDPFEGNKRGWAMVDLFTASAMLAVMNALSPEHRAKFDNLPFMKLVNFTWKHVK